MWYEIKQAPDVQHHKGYNTTFQTIIARIRIIQADMTDDFLNSQDLRITNTNQIVNNKILLQKLQNLVNNS